MVPLSFGCGSAVFAAIATLAPSRAARNAIASPMPRLAPEMNSVLPLSEVMEVSSNSFLPLPNGERSDRIGRCDPGEGDGFFVQLRPLTRSLRSRPLPNGRGEHS